jgi:hypothetical protein
MHGHLSPALLCSQPGPLHGSCWALCLLALPQLLCERPACCRGRRSAQRCSAAASLPLPADDRPCGFAFNSLACGLPAALLSCCRRRCAGACPSAALVTRSLPLGGLFCCAAARQQGWLGWCGPRFRTPPPAAHCQPVCRLQGEMCVWAGLFVAAGPTVWLRCPWAAASPLFTFLLIRYMSGATGGTGRGGGGGCVWLDGWGFGWLGSGLLWWHCLRWGRGLSCSVACLPSQQGW